MATWKEKITKCMAKNKDGWKNYIESRPAKVTGWLDTEFDDGYGATEGCPFTLWTKDYVYFPICYDGAERCGSAPRNPGNVALEHQGGG